jgi:heat shock protein HslJ
VYASRMPSKHLLLCCAILANVALTIAAGCATRASEEVAAASSVPLANTQWRLTQLGAELVPPSQGADAMGMQLQSQNTRVVGFSGCNRMFGAYALDGQSLKFAQMGGTKMACMDQGRMRLEQQYLEMFSRVAGWKISGETLELLDGQGKPVATFVASRATA